MIAVIAGTGSLPLEACKQLIIKKKPFFVIALFPENNMHDLEVVTQDHAEIIVKDVYKAGSILSLLKEKQTSDVLMIGKVDKNLLLKKVTLDWLAIKLLGSLIFKADKDILERIITELEEHNIHVLRQDEILGGLLIKPGILTGTMSDSLEQNITFGMQTARSIAHANIGQTVVVKDGMVLAVEAIEGTDACIKRGLELGKKEIIICKVARIDQNKKYDLPTLGPQSLISFKKGDISAIAWDSQHTLIAHKEFFIEEALKLEITLISI